PARRHGLAEGDAVTLATRRGAATFTARLTPDIREDTVFVPFHWPEEASANRLTNPALDPISRMPEFKVCAVRIAPALGARDSGPPGVGVPARPAAANRRAGVPTPGGPESRAPRAGAAHSAEA